MLVESVARLEVRGGRAAVTGAVIGAVVDVVLIVSLIDSMNESWGSVGGRNDRDELLSDRQHLGRAGSDREEAQMYGGAILRSLARTDRAPSSTWPPARAG